ncbi:Fic family protein (plasmid) [Stanieria sp. NIES-3757]|nr:Fic family protein [Stanieria sp. NIES-3757]
MDLNTLQITPQILNLIAEIDEFKGSWRALGTLAPERLAALRKVATIESIGSSTRIEGAKLSDRQIETLLSNLDSLSFTTRDEQEVAGYAQVMQILFDSWEMIPITENYIKQLHSILLQYSHKDERHRGNYKAIDNHIEAFDGDGKSLGILFTTASPMMTPLLMEKLVNWTREAFTDKQLHPLLITGIFIVRFLAIHPFQDGNGRLSRVLTTLLLLKSGYTYVPFSSLETVIEENKDSYYLALRRTQQSLKTENPDWNSWLLFFLHSLKRQKDRLAVKLEREKIMQSSLPELSVKILELAKEHGRITTGEIERYTQANRSTIKARINDLLGMKKLIRHGKGRSTWYSLF